MKYFEVSAKTGENVELVMNECVKQIEGTDATIADTRKTLPGLRSLQKYAVTCGGGKNHRYNLSDGVLLKDNHIGAAGVVKEAILGAKAYAPFVRKIEIEVENLDMVKEAVEAGANIIMLDNPEVFTLSKFIHQNNILTKLVCFILNK